MIVNTQKLYGCDSLNISLSTPHNNHTILKYCNKNSINH